MKHGFITVAAASPKIRVGDCSHNTASIIETIIKAREKGVSALTLPELCITGSTCGDLFFCRELFEAAKQSLISIVKHTKDMLVIVGVPLLYKSRLFNCAAVMSDAKLIGICVKAGPDNMSGRDERRHFSYSLCGFHTISIGEWEVPIGDELLFKMKGLDDFTFGVEIGWRLCSTTPSKLAKKGAVVIFNPCAEPATSRSDIDRANHIKSYSSRLACAFVCANAGDGESTTDLVFSGDCLVAEDNELLIDTGSFCSPSPMAVTQVDVQRLTYLRLKRNMDELAPGEFIPFELAIKSTKLSRSISRFPFIPFKDELELKNTLLIQAHGLKKRLEHTGAKAILGVSGGLDSTLALLVCVKAIELMGKGSDMLHLITMPCFGTSKKTLSNAQRLCEALKLELHTIDITNSVKSHLKDIGHDMITPDTCFENAQARERTQVLMDRANQIGGIVIGTGDLSELALGFCTYNGDHMSMYGVNGSIPKTLARELVRYCASFYDNEQLRDVLFDIIKTPPSPELLPSDGEKSAQHTEELIGPYELHDFFLYHFLCMGATKEKTQRLAEYAFNGVYEQDTISYFLDLFFKRFFNSQFKRSCMPDGPKATKLSLSPRGGLQMPCDAVNWGKKATK